MYQSTIYTKTAAKVKFAEVREVKNMKNRGFLFIILIAVLLICPLAATGGAKAPEKGGNEVTKTNIQDDGDSILVLSSSTRKINEIDMFEYVVAR